MPSYEALKNKQNELIRKALDGSAFVANITATPIAALTTTGGELATLPAGYDDLGWLTSAGTAFARNVESSDVTSWGAVEPTRSDVTRDSATMTVVAQETKLRTLELYTGADLSATVPASTGEVVIDKPPRPSSRYYRALSLAVDQADAGEVYIGRFFPRGKPTSFAEQTFSDGDEPITYGVTLTAFVDSALGFSERWLFGGPGWTALLADMGFPAPAS